MLKQQLKSDAVNQSNLLQLLHAKERTLLLDALEPIELRAGQILYEPGNPVYHTYFPCGKTLISYIVLLDDARRVETALIGREGAIGGIVSQGQMPAYCQALVQFSGVALRIESSRLEYAKSQSTMLRHFFARYSDCLLAQIFQTVACNATHTLEQRTAKWLLSVMERTGESTIPLTQEQLAGMLGVGRSYVSRVVNKMKVQGALHTSRGKLVASNIPALEHIACHCNGHVREHFNTVLAGLYPTDERMEGQ